jgi:hypothetical protein
MGTLKLIGVRDLNVYSIEHIKRVRIVRRVDGYYVQLEPKDMVIIPNSVGEIYIHLQ